MRHVGEGGPRSVGGPKHVEIYEEARLGGTGVWFRSFIWERPMLKTRLSGLSQLRRGVIPTCKSVSRF